MLGMSVTRDRTARTLTISQQGYVDRLLARFDAPLNAVSTPMEQGLQLCAAVATHKAGPADVARYQSVVGALMYAAACTRPDIAFAVSILGRYSSSPDTTHWAAVKHLLRYLRGTAGRGITYTATTSASGSKPPASVLTCYTDADYAACLDDRKSISGYALTLTGGAVSWASRKQRTVALSTTQAEFAAMTELAKDVLWWRSFLGEVGLNMGEPTTLFCDNMGAVDLAYNPAHHERTKHFSVQQQFIRELLNRGDITIDYVPTQRNVADILTKGLARLKHSTCMAFLGMPPP